jgi:hypothetical protein
MSDPIDDAIDALFPGMVLVPRNDAFTAFGIKKSYGHELIDQGILERIKLGNASRITIASIKRAAHGLPSRAERLERPGAGRDAEPALPSRAERLEHHASDASSGRLPRADGFLEPAPSAPLRRPRGRPRLRPIRGGLDRRVL